MPMSSRVPVGNLAIPVLSNLLASRVSGSSRGFAPVTSGPFLQFWELSWFLPPWLFWELFLLLLLFLFLDMDYHLPASMSGGGRIMRANEKKFPGLALFSLTIPAC